VIRSPLSRLRAWAHDLVRVGLLGVLGPAADHLPRKHALALASVAGRLDASWMFDDTGVRNEMLAAFALQGGAAVVAARTRAARRYLDFVVYRRIRSGREDPASWRVEERGAEVLDELRRSGDSFVIATGHFARHPSYALWTGATIPHRIVGVTLPARDPSHPSSLGGRWGSTHLALQLDVWGRAPDVEFLMVDNRLVAATLVARLRRPGTAVVISADAPIGPDHHAVDRRAFAGRTLQDFALGTATIAGFAGCQIVVCVPYLVPDGTVVLEWAGPITPATNGGVGEPTAADIRVMDRILDELERMIGRRPAQYVLPIGHDRQWNQREERWESLEESPPAPDRSSRLEPFSATGEAST
jgi:lauroyl/myristoyl acyltransferase